LRRARGADRDQAGGPDPRSAWRPHPHPGADHRGDRHRKPAVPAGGGAGNVRASLRCRSGDAPLPGRARDLSRRRAGGGRTAAVRRSVLRPLRRPGASPRRRVGPRHASGGRAVTPNLLPVNEPALEGAAAEGQPVVVGDAAASPLERVLARGRLRATLAMLGPAFVAAVAYVDPGNFATNVQGGARYGYVLLWVVLAANLMAMLIQYLSAKLGIVTDRNLPEVVRERFPRPLTWGMWVQAEIMAMSTDIAEFLGAALGLNLLFGVPLLPAGLITGVIAFAILWLQTRGF